MRWLFLIMLSFNLVYLAWQTAQPAVPSYENVLPLKGVQPIVLLSELVLNEPVLSESDLQLAVVATAAQTAVLQRDVEVKQQEQIGAESKNEKNQLSQLAETVVSAQKIEMKAQSLLAVNLADLVVEAEPLQAFDGEQEKQSHKDRCFTFGYFRDKEALVSLSREIGSYVKGVEFRDTEKRELSLHWVFVRPAINRKEAVETGQRLKEKEISDFYVIREGEKKYGVSLGRFRNKNGAYWLAEKVRNLGFDVIVEPVYKTYTAYWLDYRLVGEAGIPEPMLAKYLRPAGQGKVTNVGRACDI